MLKLIVSLIAFVYILPSWFILERVRKNLLFLSEPVTLYGKGRKEIEKKEINFSFTLSIDGKNFYMEVDYPAEKEFLISFPEGVTRIIGKKPAPLTTAFPYIAKVLNFLLYSPTYEPARLSIDKGIVSLTRFKEKGEIVYSIGATDGFLEMNQMWILKDAFIPRRIIIVKREGIFDLVFEEFYPSRGGLFPALISFRDPDGKGILKIEKWKKGKKVRRKIVLPSPHKEEMQDIEEEYQRFREL